MLNQRYGEVIILGSGFSKSVSESMPTMKDLTRDIMSLTDNPEYSHLARFVGELLAMSGHSNELLTVEQIASLILSRSMYYNNEERISYEILKHQLLRWIFDRIEAHQPRVDEAKSERLLSFFRNISSGRPDALPSLVISFNYDLLVERLLQSKPDAPKVDYLITLNRYDREQDMSDKAAGLKLHYLKLHGSLNWFAAPGSLRYDLSDVYLVEPDEPSKFLVHYQDIPVYIPMTFTKSTFFSGSLYNILWNIARRRIEEAPSIRFIGYGFPPTDSDNLYFFLKHKEKISEIVIYEEEPGPLERLKKLFPDTTIHNMDAWGYLQKVI
ncbi:MAG: hypothetical protein Kow00127_07750 [Bacteroidales bacterium]